MKMVMPLIAAESGKVSHAAVVVLVIEAGDLLATLELKDPSKVKKISTFSGQLRVPEADDAAATPEEALEAAVTRVNMFLDGYSLNGEECISNSSTRSLLSRLTKADGSVPLMSWSKSSLAT